MTPSLPFSFKVDEVGVPVWMRTGQFNQDTTEPNTTFGSVDLSNN